MDPLDKQPPTEHDNIDTPQHNHPAKATKWTIVAGGTTAGNVNDVCKTLRPIPGTGPLPGTRSGRDFLPVQDGYL